MKQEKIVWRMPGMRIMSRQVLVFVLCILTLAGCTGRDDNAVVYPQPDDKTYTGIPIVIYDTDIGSSTDDLFAMGILYWMAHIENCKLIGGIVCRMGDSYVKTADILNTYYGFGDLPMGVDRHGVEDPYVYIPYSGIADLKKADGSPLFRRSIDDYAALPEGWQLYRRLLAEQPAHSVDICAIGFMSSVVQLLESGPDEYSPLSGIELVKEKVHGLYVMGGKFGEDNNSKVGYNFGHKTAINFSIRMLDLWPRSVPIYFSPSLPGDYLDYPSDKVISDLDWIDVNPIKQVYQNYNCNTGQRMWDTYPAMMAAVQDLSIFSFSQPGFVHINKLGTTEDGTDTYDMVFELNTAGNCYFQMLENEAQRILHMQVIKDSNTSEDTLSPYIHP